MRGDGEITEHVRNKLKGNVPKLEGWWTGEGSPSATSFERRERCSGTVEAPEKGLVGNGARAHKRVLDSLAHLKCIYTNARSMSNKLSELEAIMQHENYDLAAITETWWDASHDWSAAIDGYKLRLQGGTDREGEMVEGPCM